MKYILGLGGIAIICFGLFVVTMLAIGKTGRIDTWKARIERFTSDDNQDNYQTDQAKLPLQVEDCSDVFRETVRAKLSASSIL